MWRTWRLRALRLLGVGGGAIVVSSVSGGSRLVEEEDKAWKLFVVVT